MNAQTTSNSVPSDIDAAIAAIDMSKVASVDAAAGILADEALSRAPRGPVQSDPLTLLFGDLPPQSDDSERAFAQIEALVKAKTPATGFGAVAQTLIKGVIESLEQAGQLDKFEVVLVAKDPTRPIVYYITKDAKVIATELNKVGLRAFPQILGFSLDFFNNFGQIDLKPSVGLVLPSGDCLLLTSG